MKKKGGSALAVLLCACLSCGLLGCRLGSGMGCGGGGFGGGGGGIDIGGGGSGSGWDSGGVPPATGPESPPPPGGDEDTAPPQSPGTQQPGPTMPGSAQAMLSEIRSKYGVPVSGRYNAEHVKKLWVSLAQYRPEETRGVRVNFVNNGGNRGVAGLYSWGGSTSTITIYSGGFHTIHHELAHHMTLFYRNNRCNQIAKQTITAAKGGYGRLMTSCIPSGYSLTNYKEWWAEFFSFFREKDRRIYGQESCRASFNPPENVRQIARQIYAN